MADLPIQLPAMPFLSSEEAWALALTTFAGLSTCIGAGFAVRSVHAVWVLAAALQTAPGQWRRPSVTPLPPPVAAGFPARPMLQNGCMQALYRTQNGCHWHAVC